MMEHKDTKNNLFLLTIVGIVAIVAIVILVASTGSRTYTLSEDSAGQATRAAVEMVTEGKPVTDSTTTATTATTICTDSDGGKNYTVKGTTKVGTSTKTDFCMNYNGTLVEYYCNKNKIASTSPLPSQCPYGCENGACRTQPAPFCGDGNLTGYEMCDGDNLGGLTCSDIGSFTGGMLSCTIDCHFDLSNCDVGFGYCGDSIINNFPSEQCDGYDWGQINSCTDFGFTGGTLTCNSANETNETNYCLFDTRLCTTPAGYGTCGDQIINIGEQCEANRPLTLTCTDFGYYGGILSCDYSTCIYDISGCENNITGYCGDGIVQAEEECDDGNSNNYDACTNDCIYVNQTINTCYDTEVQSSIYVPGRVWGYLNGTPYNKTDGCYSSTGVIERYCSGNNDYSYSVQCPNNGVCYFDFEGGRCVNQTVGTVSRRFSTNSAAPNTVISVTLTKNFAFQQGTLLIEEYVPSSFVILSNGGGSISGNTIRWALLSNITPGNYTYTVRTSPNPGIYSFSGVYSANGEATQAIIGSTQVTVLNQTTTTGNLYVSTTPTAASLYVDNIYKGVTPRTVTNLTVGNHSIRLNKTGYYTYTTIKYISAGQTTNLNVNLTQNQTSYDLYAQDILIQGAYGSNISIYTNGTYNYVYGNSQVILKPQVKNTGSTAINAYNFYNRITFGSANGTNSTYTRCSSSTFWINPGITYTCNSDNVARTLLVGQPVYPISIGVDYYNNIPETNENNNARTEMIYVYSEKEDGR